MKKLALEEMVKFAFKMKDICQKILKKIPQEEKQPIDGKILRTICKDRDSGYYCNIVFAEKSTRTFLSINMDGDLGIHKAPNTNDTEYKNFINTLKPKGFKIYKQCDKPGYENSTVNTDYVCWEMPEDKLKELIGIHYECWLKARGKERM